MMAQVAQERLIVGDKDRVQVLTLDGEPPAAPNRDRRSTKGLLVRLAALARTLLGLPSECSAAD